MISPVNTSPDKISPEQISKALLDILCCPACHGDLAHDPKTDTLTCLACGRVYRTEEEMPFMIPGEEKKKL